VAWRERHEAVPLGHGNGRGLHRKLSQGHFAAGDGSLPNALLGR